MLLPPHYFHFLHHISTSHIYFCFCSVCSCPLKWSVINEIWGNGWVFEDIFHTWFIGFAFTNDMLAFLQSGFFGVHLVMLHTYYVWPSYTAVQLNCRFGPVSVELYCIWGHEKYGWCTVHLVHCTLCFVQPACVCLRPAVSAISTFWTPGRRAEWKNGEGYLWWE